MDYDSASNMKVVTAITPAIYTTDQLSTALNTANYPYKALSIAIYVGAGGITFDATNKLEFNMTHSDDDSVYVDCTDDDLILPYPLTTVEPGGIVKSLVAAHATADITVLGYRGKKKYVKIEADFFGTHGVGTTVGVNWILTHPMSAPTWQAAVTDRPQI
jgi:hypothetical protein